MKLGGTVFFKLYINTAPLRLFVEIPEKLGGSLLSGPLVFVFHLGFSFSLDEGCLFATTQCRKKE